MEAEAKLQGLVAKSPRQARIIDATRESHLRHLLAGDRVSKRCANRREGIAEFLLRPTGEAFVEVRTGRRMAELFPEIGREWSIG